MTKIVEQLATQEKPKKEKKNSLLSWSFLSAAIWMLLGHGYFFLSDAFNFDSLHVIGQADTEWKLSLGRFAQPIYKDLIRGNITAPWLIGIFATIFLALSVYLLTKIFPLRSKWSVFLTAGVIGVNLAIILAMGSYIHEVDIFFLAFLLQVLAVYLWTRQANRIFTLVALLLGAVSIAFSLGLYQAYISVGVALVLLVCLQWCFDDSATVKKILTKAIQAVAMFAVGCILYNLFVQMSIAGTTTALSSDTNGITNLWNYGDKSFVAVLAQTYAKPLEFLFVHTSKFSPGIVVFANWVLLAVIILGSVVLSRKNKTKFLMTIVLLLLFPFALALVCFLNPASYYELMTHAYALYYILVIVIVEGLTRLPKQNRGIRWTKITCITLIGCILGCSVRFANQVYIRKDLESKAVMSYMTEVFTRMDQIDGYVPGETPVLFLSKPNVPSLGYEFDGFEEFAGVDVNSFYATKWRFQWYLQFVMQRPVNLFDDTEAIDRFLALEQVQAMPTFPALGSMQMIEYVLVIKLSDNPW